MQFPMRLMNQRLRVSGRFAAAGLALPALLATTGAAHAETRPDGFISATGGVYNVAFEGVEHLGATYDLRGSVALPVGDTNLGVQFDADWNNALHRFAAHDATLQHHNLTFALHGFARGKDGRLGILVQTTETGDEAFGAPIPSHSIFFTGIEGQHQFGKLALSARATAIFVEPFSGTSSSTYSNGYDLGAGAKYFLQPNTSLAIAANLQNTTYTFRHANGSFRLTYWQVGGLGEHRIGHSRFSVTAGVDYYQNQYREKGNGQPPSHEVRGLVGVKLNFGSKTLLEREQTGASLDPVAVRWPKNIIF